MKEYSDKDSPRKLEDIFRQRFDGAEVTPPDRVWDRIEQGLDLKEAGYYKNKMAWYRTLAAACIALVVLAGGYLFYDLKTEHQSGAVASRQHTDSNETADGNANVASPAGPAGAPASVNELNGSQLAGTAAENSAATIAGIANNNALKATRSPVRNGRKNLTSRPEETLNNHPGVKIGLVSAHENELPAMEAPEATSGNGFAVTALSARFDNLAVNHFSSYPDTLKLIKQELKSLPGEPVLAAVTGKDAGPKINRWTIAGKYSPQYFNQNVTLGENGNKISANAFSNSNSPATALAAPTSYSEALNEFDRNTKPLYSYSTSVSVGYQLNKHFNLETGADFTENLAHTSSTYIFNNSQLAARLNANSMSSDLKGIPENLAALPTTAFLASITGQATSVDRSVSRTNPFDTRYRYRLVGIPVRVSYQSSRSKSFYYASVGFVTNLLVQAHIISDTDRVPNIKYAPNRDSPFRNWQFAAVGGLGKGFRITDAIGLRAGLEATQYLTTLAANPGNAQGKPYSIGVAVSSSYTLGK